MARVDVSQSCNTVKEHEYEYSVEYSRKGASIYNTFIGSDDVGAVVNLKICKKSGKNRRRSGDNCRRWLFPDLADR
jgi:hypothetical protein